MVNKIKVTYRQIAKHFCRALPIEGTNFGEKVSEVTEVIKRMPKAQRQALQCAYIFSHKVPRQERDDLFQELTLAILESQTEDIRLSYAIARCDWVNFWQKYKTKQHYQLEFDPDDETSYRIGINQVHLETLTNISGDMAEIASEVCADVIDRHEQRLLTETLIAEVDWELRQCEKIDAKRVWNSLPPRIQRLARDRLVGKALNGADRLYLHRFIQANPMILAQS